MKYKIDKKEYDELNEAFKALYSEKGDDYILKVEGLPYSQSDFDTLKRAKDREVQEKNAALERLSAAETRLKEYETDPNRSQDIQTLQKSWNEEKATMQSVFDAKLSKKDSEIRKLLIEDGAKTIANKVSTYPSILQPHVEKRISVEFDKDGSAKRVILDKDGNPTDLDGLEKEFLESEDFSAIIIGSKASGGGAPGNDGKGGGAITKLSDFKNATEQALFEKNHPTEFAQLK